MVLIILYTSGMRQEQHANMKFPITLKINDKRKSILFCSVTKPSNRNKTYVRVFLTCAHVCMCAQIFSISLWWSITIL